MHVTRTREWLVRYSVREREGFSQCGVADDGEMIEEPMTTAELLEQWREATRAAELAARLAKMAADSVDRTEKGASAAEELAQLAERAAEAASAAAETARRAADQAAELARQSVADRTRDDKVTTAAEGLEEQARERYHEAEREARGRLSE